MTTITQPLTSTRRRCAAFMTLSEVLEGEQLMRALWMLEERDQTADKMTFIGFVGVTAELLGINSNLITTLYSKLNQILSFSDQELTDDPMPQMLEFRGIEKSSAQATANRDQAATIQPTKKTPAKIKGTPEMTVFVALISSIASEAEYPQAESYNLFNEVFKEEIAEAGLDDDNREQIISWVDGLSIKAFKKNISAKKLAIMVHCIYIALCEALGPVKADEVLNHAIGHASKLSAAKSFSPKNFL